MALLTQPYFDFSVFRKLPGSVLRLSLFLLALLLAGAVQAGDFISLCYHEVERDDVTPLTRTSVRAGDLAAQFAWLQANGYHPVSLQQIVNARQGGKSLPSKAILLTFDDGKKDIYTRVFPLLRLFNYPAVVALVGSWLDVPEGGTVDYDGVDIPRSAFVSWADVRVMQNSGLVEFASHSYALHRGVLANPQGNTEPAAITRVFSEGFYETDTQYLARIRADLARNSELIRQQTGKMPRSIVWPYGRSNAAAQGIAEALGMPVGMTLEDGKNSAQTPLERLRRYLIEESPDLQSYADAVRGVWRPDPERSVLLRPGEWVDINQGLSHALDRLQRIVPNVAFVDPRTFPQATTANESAAQGPLLFPTTWHALASDSLNHIAWQIERRAGVPVFIDLPAAWLQDTALLADLARYVNFSGVRMPVAPDNPLAKAALAAIKQWRWPVRVAYALPEVPSPTLWSQLREGDFIVLPASLGKAAEPGVPVADKSHVLFEFDPLTQSAEHIAAEMRRLEADGFRQFGIVGFPESGFGAVEMALSLRSQPFLP